MECYSNACQYSTRLIEKLESLDLQNTLDFDLIDKAIYWAKKYHDGQYRKSGEPFYSHPLEVAYMISDHLPQTTTIVASILHDIVEDTEVTIGMILDEFGWRVSKIVDRLTRDRPDGTKLSVEEILNNAYEQNDEEVLLIKCCDRLHNIQTIAAQKLEKQRKNAKETIDHFIILSMYLEKLDIEKEFSQKCHFILSSNAKISDISFMYNFLQEKDNFPLPALSFYNNVLL